MRACVFSKTYAVKSFFVAGTSWTRQEEEQPPMIDLHPLQTLTFWSHCYSVAKATCLRPSEVQTEPLRKSQRVPPTAQPPLRWLCARLIEFTCPDLTGGGRETLEIDFYRVLACICGRWLTAVKNKGSLFASVVLWRNFNIHGIFLLYGRSFYSTKKCSIKNCPLKVRWKTQAKITESVIKAHLKNKCAIHCA